MNVHIKRLSSAIVFASPFFIAACGGSGDSSTPPLASATPTPTPSPSSSPPTVSDDWELVWSDEFDGTSIDFEKWEFETNCWGGGNNEQQCYTDRDVNAFIADGVLNIVAIREDFTGNNGPDGVSGSEVTLPYTSARLRTRGLQEWTFGRFEIRARMPFGQGTWPAIWMLPTDSPYGGWASSGEIDIVEAVNLKVDGEDDIHGTLHYGRAWPENVNSGQAFELPDDQNPADDFHTYAIEWESGEIRWYVDDIHYATQQQTGWYSQYEVDGQLVDAPAGAPFDSAQAFHLILNFAVGGNWAGSVNQGGIDESVFPQTFSIDWVRVYECSVSPMNGSGCATVDSDAPIVEGNTPPPLSDGGSTVFGQPPLFTVFLDGLAEGTDLGSFNPDGTIEALVEPSEGRGDVFTVSKTGPNGNLYFFAPDGALDMSAWVPDGKLAFDFRVNSNDAGNSLLIKMDSGWPNVSDVSVPLPSIGEWSEFSIDVSDLLENGNSIADGIASASSIINFVVIEPQGAMNVSFDNIRFEQN